VFLIPYDNTWKLRFSKSAVRNYAYIIHFIWYLRKSSFIFSAEPILWFGIENIILVIRTKVGLEFILLFIYIVIEIHHPKIVLRRITKSSFLEHVNVLSSFISSMCFYVSLFRSIIVETQCLIGFDLCMQSYIEIRIDSSFSFLYIFCLGSM